MSNATRQAPHNHLHQGVVEVEHYLKAVVAQHANVQSLTGVAQTGAAMLDRTCCLIGSLAVLDGASHYQAHLAITRALFEVAVDLALIRKDPSLNSKLLAWEDSERLELAKALRKSAADGLLPPESGHEATKFIQRHESRIEQLRIQFWNGKHPRNRWTGNAFPADLEQAHVEVPALDLRRLHKQFWRVMCWNVHGGGAVLRRRAGAAQVIQNTSAIASMVCPDLAFGIAELALRAITGFRSDEQKALLEATQRRLLKISGIDPDELAAVYE